MADGVHASENVGAGEWGLRRTAPARATDAALKVATGGHEVVFNGKLGATWRVRPDAVVEVARGNWGRVELFEVYGDGTSQLVATSGRSLSKVAAYVCFIVSCTSFAASIVGGMAGVDAAVVLFGIAVLSFPLVLLLTGRSGVRPWLSARFGSDADWVDVPGQMEGAPTTANQAVALAAAARSGHLRYRVADDGVLEVVRLGKDVEVLSIDKHGATTTTERLPLRGFRFAEFRGDVTWHQVGARTSD